MRKISVFSLMLGLCLLLALPIASAWAPEGFADTWEDLPETVRALLPQDEAYTFGFYNAQTYYVLMEGAHAFRTIYVLQPNGDGSYYVDLQSAPLPSIRGSRASLGSTGTNYLYLIYDGGGSYFSFTRQADGRWLLSYVQAGDEFGIDPIFGLAVHGQDSNTSCLVGKMPDYNLANLDPRTLPKTVEEAAAVIDTSGYALVKSDVPTDRLHLRASPSKNVASHGRYYSGTPVRVLSVEGGWAKVDICGVEGYMLADFLAFGQDMLDVKRYFPSMTLREEACLEGVPIYLAPKESTGTFVGQLGGDPRQSVTTYILANVGDDWLHVVCNNGLTGFVQAKYFWAGNG